MKAVLYSTGCNHCKALERALDKNGVEYEICSDEEIIKSKGIMTVPVLEVGDKKYGYSEAITKIKEILYLTEDTTNE